MNSVKVAAGLAAALFLPLSAWAVWSGPVEIVTGEWGSREDQFGFRERYNKAEFPRQFLVDGEGNIVIADSANKRAKVYSGKGKLRGIIKPQTGYEDLETWPTAALGVWDGKVFVDAGEHFQYYGYDGKLKSEFKVPDGRFRKLLDDGSIIVVMFGKSWEFRRYSHAGALLQTYQNKPLVLGNVEEISEDKSNVNEGWTRITYPDATYNLVETGSTFRDYRRDRKGNLYLLDNPLARFDSCGNPAGTLQLPQSQYEEIRPATAPSGGIMEAVAEYSLPVVDSGGNVYVGKRTRTSYSILKWTWEEESHPNVAWQDEPRNLAAFSTMAGTDLTWDTSLQDPGCVTGYEIGRSAQAGGPYKTIGTVSRGVLKYHDGSASPAAGSYYAVRAVMGGRYSGYSNEALGGLGGRRQ